MVLPVAIAQFLFRLRHQLVDEISADRVDARIADYGANQGDRGVRFRRRERVQCTHGEA